MSIPLEAIIGDLHIIGGVRQPMTAPTATFEPPRRCARGRGNDRLFVLVEMRPPDVGATIEATYAPYSKAVDQLSTAYWRTEGSVTAALRAALTAANDWLMDYNLQSPVLERFRAGITCVALRESTAFIAQAGPAACYVAHQGQVERFPSRDVAAPALGASRGLEIRYSRAELQHGDVVLLCDSLTAERLPDATISNAIVYVGVPTALVNLERLAVQSDLIAMLIEATAVGKPIHTEPPAPSPAAPARRPQPKVVEPDFSEPDAVPEIARPRQGQPSLRSRLSDQWQRLRGSIAAANQAIPRVALINRARQVMGSVAAGVTVAGQGAKESVQRMLPEGPPVPPKRAAPGSTLIGAGLTIIIPLLITALVVYSYTQRRQQTEFELVLNTARTEAARAQTTLDEDKARALWQQAWEHANDALGRRPASLDARALHDQSLGKLDQIDQVTRVKTFLLYDFGPGSNYRLALQGTNVFVMNSQQLWHITLAETGASLLGAPPIRTYAGESVSSRQVGALLDLAWVSANGLRTKSSLLILETGGLLEHDPAWNVQAVALGQGEARPDLRLMAAFGGNLYVMDNSQLWRYKPLGNGFGTAAEAYFNSPPGDLSTAIDLAIDGSVYLLYADGRIRKFFGGDEHEFTPTALPDPLARPVALAADAEATRGSIYVADAGPVADAGLARVVQLTSRGIFVRQIKTHDDSMNSLESVFVDERAERLLFISGGKLYTAPLPTLQSP